MDAEPPPPAPCIPPAIHADEAPSGKRTRTRRRQSLIASASWNGGPARDVWTIPVGGGVGKVSLLDGQPIDVLLAAYWDAIRPKDIPSPAWQLRVQLAWPFPR